MPRYIGERFAELYVGTPDGKISLPCGNRTYENIGEAKKKFPYDRCYIKVGEHWCHRTTLKCIINPVLRALQFWNRRPYVIASITEFKDDGLPYFNHYAFQRVERPQTTARCADEAKQESTTSKGKP